MIFKNKFDFFFLEFFVEFYEKQLEAWRMAQEHLCSSAQISRENCLKIEFSNGISFLQNNKELFR